MAGVTFMGAPKDLTGLRFGRLTATRVVAGKLRKWECACDCGEVSVVITAALINGNTKSCGCLSVDLLRTRVITHGDSKSRLYQCWSSMRGRCQNPADTSFSYYGGRGISVCSEWQDYLVFREWALSHGYSDDLTLERLDVNKGYGPNNCLWIIHEAQALNQTPRRDILRSDGTLFPSVAFAARVTKTPISGVSQALSGRRKSAGGYGWKYYDDVGRRAEAFEIAAKGPRTYGRSVMRSDGIFFPSIVLAASSVGVNCNTIRKYIRTGNQLAGFTWRLATDSERDRARHVRAA